MPLPRIRVLKVDLEFRHFFLYSTYLFLLLGCGSNSDSSGIDATPTITTDEILNNKLFSVGTLTKYQVVDDERNRSFSATIWYPSENISDDNEESIENATLAMGDYPLVISAHGGGSNASAGEMQLKHLASYGFIVIAPDFPNTNSSSRPLDINDVINQPADISFIIDAALGINNSFEQRFKPVIDPDRIGLVGTSLGGITVLLTAFDKELRDPRVKAVLPIAPGGGDFLLPKFYDNADIPVLLVHGTADGWIDYDSVGRTVFSNTNSPSTIITIEGGTHTGYSLILEEYSSVNVDLISCIAAPAIVEDASEDSFHFYLHNRGLEFGIGEAVAPLPCTYGAETLPAIPPSKQIELTQLAMVSFFINVLSADNVEKLRYGNFLTNTFSEENSEISIEIK